MDKYSKYIDLKKEALSEEFIYCLYFEKRQNEIEKYMKRKNSDCNNSKLNNYKNESCNLEQNTSNIPIQGEIKHFETKYQNYII